MDGSFLLKGISGISVKRIYVLAAPFLNLYSRLSAVHHSTHKLLPIFQNKSARQSLWLSGAFICRIIAKAPDSLYIQMRIDDATVWYAVRAPPLKI